jgi:hypothetical protein
MVFGAAGLWLLTARFASAKFLRAGYALMAVAGAIFMVWGTVRILVLGIAGAALLAAGGAVGVYGALRGELRR